MILSIYVRGATMCLRSAGKGHCGISLRLCLTYALRNADCHAKMD